MKETQRKRAFKGIPYRTTLDFDEITGPRKFEELVAAYFKSLPENRENNIATVGSMNPSSVGPDGGVDIVVTLNMTDSLSGFQRKWVVQCKFHESSVGIKALGAIQLTSLIEQYDAVGYLLICKTNPTTQLARLFKDLTENKNGYQYLIWTGEQFKSRLLEQPSIHKQFFPEYHAYTELLSTIKQGQP
ncbi:MAG: hypothetical protein DYG96_01545 [Chlorobi bacterium CHB2]|nr:hypothetical protein [Chlorobi bacterium CHB2]